MSLFILGGIADRVGVTWSVGSLLDANPLLLAAHYLGPVRSGGSTLVVIGSRDSAVVAAQVWRKPTSRHLPNDGTWLELSRWCLTPEAGSNAGSRHHRAAVRLIKQRFPAVTTLVSYSDPSAGHTGSLYRAANWLWAPTWLRLRPPPTRQGAWRPDSRQEVKDRWVFLLGKDERRAELLDPKDSGAIRAWLRSAPDHELRWGAASPSLRRYIGQDAA